MKEKIEFVLVFLVAIICILISILDFVGALDELPWLAGRISIMTLLAVGLIATYMISYLSRSFDRIENAVNTGNQALLSSIKTDTTATSILELLDRIWKEREPYFELFFDGARKVAKSDGNESLVRFLSECEDSIDQGEAFGTKLRYPWDINLVAIDLTGKILYHRFESMISSHYGLDHPSHEILKERNGSFFWVNNTAGKIRRIGDFPFKKILRFTKLYFKEMPHLEAIVIVQSHINILPNTIKGSSLVKEQ